MADKWDEITQLEVAYDALRTQPRDAQARMLQWLADRLASDHENTLKARAAPGKPASQETK
jgi:hypothetical protein